MGATPARVQLWAVHGVSGYRPNCGAHAHFAVPELQPMELGKFRRARSLWRCRAAFARTATARCCRERRRLARWSDLPAHASALSRLQFQSDLAVLLLRFQRPALDDS